MSRERDIELDCVVALAGAGEVRNKIISGLALGYPSVEDHAYLIKCRVKDHASLVKKVKDRREKGKPDYSAHDATDIIGLRLLALFREGIPSLVSRFLSFVKAGQSEEFSVFLGNSFRETCVEIILYTTANENDSVDNLVLDEFRRVDPGIEVKVVRKQSQYSSIHLILWCRNGFTRHTDQRLALEVQIRTSLEDVWGEIDHELSYKNESLGSDESALRHVEMAREQLINLKKQLDICSSAADSIKRQMGFAKSRDERSTVLRSALSVNLGILAELPVLANEKLRLAPSVEQLRHAFNSLKSADYTETIEKTKALSDEFSRLGDIFEQVLVSVEKNPQPVADKQNESRYYLLMEAALCYYWSGRILGSLDATQSAQINNQDGANCAEMSAQLFERSLKIYSRVGEVISYYEDAILAYRMANVLSAQGRHDIALEKFREAVDFLKNHEQKNLAENHFLRVRIPRQLGVAIWDCAERYKIEGDQLGVHDFLIEKRRRLYLEAMQVTAPLLESKISGETDDSDQFSNSAETNRGTANNVLDYALCYMRSGGLLAEIQAKVISEAQLLKLVTVVEGSKGVSSMFVPVQVDTIRAAKFELLQDLVGAKVAASRVLELLLSDRKKWKAKYGERFVSEMELDAKKTLDTHA